MGLKNRLKTGFQAQQGDWRVKIACFMGMRPEACMRFSTPC